MEKPQSALSFKAMSLVFKLRDITRPRKGILNEVGIKPGSQVLDFGCGPGGYILPLARLVGMSGKIYALDVNPLAIKSVKALAARHKLANVATILSDGPTGLRDTSVDAALLYDILHHLKNAGNILKELHRILKPDGILSVSDHHMKADDITSRITGTGLFQTGPKGKTLNFTRVK